MKRYPREESEIFFWWNERWSADFISFFLPIDARVIKLRIFAQNRVSQYSQFEKSFVRDITTTITLLIVSHRVFKNKFFKTKEEEKAFPKSMEAPFTETKRAFTPKKLPGGASNPRTNGWRIHRSISICHCSDRNDVKALTQTLQAILPFLNAWKRARSRFFPGPYSLHLNENSSICAYALLLVREDYKWWKDCRESEDLSQVENNFKINAIFTDLPQREIFDRISQ